MRAVLKPLPRIRGKILNVFENSFLINSVQFAHGRAWLDLTWSLKNHTHQ